MPVDLKDEQQLQAEMYKALRKNDLDLFQFLIDNVRKGEKDDIKKLYNK